MKRVLCIITVIVASVAPTVSLAQTPIAPQAPGASETEKNAAGSASPAEQRPAPPAFLADLDNALRQGCDSLHVYLGWEPFAPETRVCLRDGGGVTTESIVAKGGT